MTFRCWFTDTSAVLVSAETPKEAGEKANAIALKNWGEKPAGKEDLRDWKRGTTIQKIEPLGRA